MRTFSETLYDGLSNRIEKIRTKKEAYYMHCKYKITNTKNQFKKSFYSVLSYENEIESEIKSSILKWISYAFTEQRKLHKQKTSILIGNREKNFAEIINIAIFGQNEEKKQSLFSNLPNLISKGAKKNDIEYVNIDVENIQPEQKKSMNIWMYVLNINLKKITSKKISLNDLENYEYLDVFFFSFTVNKFFFLDLFNQCYLNLYDKYMKDLTKEDKDYLAVLEELFVSCKKKIIEHQSKFLSNMFVSFK